MHGWVGCRPSTSVVAETDFKGEVDQDCQCEIFLTETFIQQFEIRDSVVRLEPDFGDQVNDDDALNILQLQDTDHAAVDFHHAILFLGPLLALQHC